MAKEWFVLLNQQIIPVYIRIVRDQKPFKSQKNRRVIKRILFISLWNNIYFFIITGTCFDDSSTEYCRLDGPSSFDDPRSFDDPIVDDMFLQSSEKKVSDDVLVDNGDGSEDDSDKDDDDHSHAKKTPDILSYIF